MPRPPPLLGWLLALLCAALVAGPPPGPREGGPAPGAGPPRPIPVLGTLAYVNTGLLLRLLRSLDHPVDKVVIVHNGNHPQVAQLIAKVRQEHPEYIIKPFPNNTGIAEGWNAILDTDPDAPYHVIANDDVAFTPGSLRRFARAIEQAQAKVVAGTDNKVVLFPNHGEPSWGMWHCIAVLKQAVDAVGRFDPNFWPAYHEDFDFMVRIARVNLWQIQVPNARILHGPPRGKKMSGMDRALAHQKSEEAVNLFRNHNWRSRRGAPYYALKWGTGWTVGLYHEYEGIWNKKCHASNGGTVCMPAPPLLYARPFNDSTLPLSYTVFDPALRDCIRFGVGEPCYYNWSLLPHPELVPHDEYDPKAYVWRRK